MMMMGDWLLDRFISTQERTVWFCDRRSSIASRRVTWKRHTTLFKNCCLRIRRKKNNNNKRRNVFHSNRRVPRSAAFVNCQFQRWAFSFDCHPFTLRNWKIIQSQRMKNVSKITECLPYLPTCLPTYQLWRQFHYKHNQVQFGIVYCSQQTTGCSIWLQFSITVQEVLP